MRVFVFLFSALLAGFSIHCAAAPFAVQVGEARIGLDAPAGFSDTTFTASPRLQELSEGLTPASNRILLFALSDADLRRFTLGDPLDLRRYMIAVTPRGMERDRLTEGSFKQFIGESLGGLGAPATEKDVVKYLDSRPAGTTNLLGELRRDPDVVSVLQGARTKGPGFFERSKYMLSSTTLMLLRGKAVSLSVYTQYDDPADLEWIRATTARWIDDLKRLNQR
ncbi:MAG TPA: hypothetical protein VFU24_07240 [Burkholderiales bacterium]|nr:hypothetical protein [Burkholderiales bacterium]